MSTNQVLMVEILCPHCDEEIELPDDSYGEFECPHCTEIFEWEEPEISHEYEEMLRTPAKIKAGAIGFVVVVFFMILAIGAIGQIAQVNTNTWSLRQGEIISIEYEGWIGGEANQYYAVDLEVEYDVGVRVTTLKCNTDRGAIAFVENHKVGDIIDIRVNPVSTYPFFVVDGGCPNPPLSTGEIVGGFVCFGLIITILGIDQIRNKIRNN